MNRLVQHLTIPVLALMAAACGSHRQQTEAPAGSDLNREITIEVENRNFNNARVYLVVFGERTRLGQVPSQTTQTFSIAAGPDHVRIEVSFIGGGGFVTEPMSVSPGDELVLQITQDAHQLRSRS
jgi:hypothetical protein